LEPPVCGLGGLSRAACAVGLLQRLPARIPGAFAYFTILAAWSALYYAINFYLIVEEQIDQLVKLDVQATSAQLAMLRYQLNPHFLFNTLNSISTLVLLKQTERANMMLSRLSSFLRYTLANEPTAQVTLAQEVETLKLYLEIEKMRFEDRLRTHFDIDPTMRRRRDCRRCCSSPWSRMRSNMR
jgi:LytS/YehU family sensor histidine kinase